MLLIDNSEEYFLNRLPAICRVLWIIVSLMYKFVYQETSGARNSHMLQDVKIPILVHMPEMRFNDPMPPLLFIVCSKPSARVLLTFSSADVVIQRLLLPES